jgi:pimeloyl-ACP methyl ester carboxylesterase
LRRGLRIALGVVVLLIALAIVNAIVLDNQRRSAEATAPGGKILHLSSVDLQVVDLPATDPVAQGEPIVLLHCFACSSRWWDPIVPLLNRHHRVIEIDLIGHGGSEKPTSGYEMEAQGGAIAEALSRLEVQGATVVGHSMGGIVATALAETASQLVDRVVLIATPAEAGMAELPLTARLLRTPVLGEAIWRLRTDSLIRSSYNDAFAPGFDSEGAFDDPNRVVDDNRAMTFTSFSDSHQESDDYLEEQSLVTRLRATGVPALAIEGAEDQILDPQAVAEDFTALPGARIETIDGAGHSPNVEKPKETAALVLEFAEADDDIEAAPPAKPRPAPAKKKTKKK